MNRRSSFRLTEWPIPPTSADVLWIIFLSPAQEEVNIGQSRATVRLLPGDSFYPHLRRRVLHGLHNVLIPSTPAQIPRDSPPNLFFARVRILIQERIRSHDHARRAEPALQPVFLLEPFLQRVKLAVPRNAFYSH